MSQRLLGFDLDGVIIDSIRCMEKAWSSACSEANLEIPFEQYRRGIGKPLKVILSEAGVEKSQISLVSRLYIENCALYEHEIRTYVPIIDFIKDQLCSRKNEIYVITSKPKIRAKELVKKIGIENVNLLCPEDTGRGKPHPDPLIKANQLSRIGKENSLYIGDMDTDMLAASSAGWDFIFAGWGYGQLKNAPMGTRIMKTPSQIWDLK